MIHSAGYITIGYNLIRTAIKIDVKSGNFKRANKLSNMRTIDTESVCACHSNTPNCGSSHLVRIRPVIRIHICKILSFTLHQNLTLINSLIKHY